MEETLTRRLAVILHADVVGSTGLVQRNETLAHERIRDAFHRFSETIRHYGGKPHEVRGDALVAEFDHASGAVAAALAFQARNAQFNTTLFDDIQPQLRIGISLGEVVPAGSLELPPRESRLPRMICASTTAKRAGRSIMRTFHFGNRFERASSFFVAKVFCRMAARLRIETFPISGGAGNARDCAGWLTRKLRKFAPESAVGPMASMDIACGSAIAGYASCAPGVSRREQLAERHS